MLQLSNFVFSEYGYHTNEEGHFEPVGQCIMGLRYRVKQKLDTKGHSAVLVLAEVGGQNPHGPYHNHDNLKLNKHFTIWPKQTVFVPIVNADFSIRLRIGQTKVFLSSLDGLESTEGFHPQSVTPWDLKK